MILSSPIIYQWFALVPEDVIYNFLVWQPFSYMFLHSENVMHLAFNMLLLWFMGGELESSWGSKYFLFYYIACGVGAAFFYLLGVILYAFIFQDLMPMKYPVIGASGAIFGLILAYGLLFGERVVYFFMIFPMKAKYFVAILSGIEVMNLLSSGFGSQISNLAHVSGLLAGYFILRIYPRLRNFWRGMGGGSGGSGDRRKLKLVVDNGARPPGRHPRYWN
jgi:membrane associated rhomboid family serine protease